MDSPPVPDELLVEIFLRIPEPADLVRVSAACVSFRRLVAGRSFLRQYRKLHAPPLLGFLDCDENFHPAVPPHPSAPAASAVALAADFSFSFLPAPARDWLIQDIRDGRVLLDRNGIDVVVCDPLHRRYLLLPRIPCDLATSVTGREIFLVSPGDGDGDGAVAAEETSFRVLWMARCKIRLVGCVFSSNTGQWRAIPSQRWSDLYAGLPPSTAMPLFYSRHYVYGCFYWVLNRGQEFKLLVLDTKTMEFSIAEPPPEAEGYCDLAMVEAGEGRPGMFVLAADGSYLNYIIKQNNCGCSSRWQFEKTREGRPGMFVLADGSSESELSSSIRQHDGRGSSQWKKKKTIMLGSRYILLGSTETHLFLSDRLGYFTLDVKTFQLAKLCDAKPDIAWRHAYSNFPPSLLSPPRISSGVENGAEDTM